jgi:hypothetical protein
MRGRRRGYADVSRGVRDVWRPLDRFLFLVWPVLRRGQGTGDELESLILAQNERWRHA